MSVTNGDPSGMSGDRRWLLFGLGAIALVATAICLVNIFTIHHEQPEYGFAWPIVLEGSSAVSTVVFAPLAFVMVRWSLGRPRPRWLLAAAHVIAAFAFSVLHVSGFVALRSLAAFTHGDAYDFGPPAQEFVYELRKDVLIYALMATTFWLVRRLHLDGSASGPALPPEPALFDIRDGARLVRTPLADILAVTSAGNYAEFVLKDGRRPLMRSSLSAIEETLAGRGFVRTHRSWLVNAARVTGLRPEGSGDYTVELGEIETPLSRRYPDALARLRGGA